MNDQSENDFIRFDENNSIFEQNPSQDIDSKPVNIGKVKGAQRVVKRSQLPAPILRKDESSFFEKPPISGSEREPSPRPDEQMMFLDDSITQQPNKNRLFTDEDQQPAQPSPKVDDEDQVLIFESVQGSAKIQVGDLQTVHAKMKNRYKGVNPSEKMSQFQKDLMDKFDKEETEGDIKRSQQLKQTETNSKLDDSNIIKSLDEMPISPSEQIPEVPHFKIGENCTIPEEIKYSNQLQDESDQQVEKISFKRAIQKAIKSPIIGYLIVLIILDLSFTNLGAYRYLLCYLFIFIATMPYLWYLHYRQSLQYEFNFDNKQILKYSFTEKRFSAVKRSKLQTGDLILLQKLERFPANILLLSVLDDDEMPDMITLSDQIDKRVLLNNVRETDLQNLEGIVEYDKRFLPLFVDESDLTLKFKVGDKKKFNTIRASAADLCAPELYQSSGQVLAMVIGTSLNQAFTAQGLRSRLLYEHVDTLDPSRAIYVLLGTSVLLSLILSIAGAVWANSNQNKHKYISSSEIGYNTSFIGLFIEHLLVYHSIVPVFLEILRPLFTLIAMFKFNRDTTSDGDRSGLKSSVSTPKVLENLGRLKFVNYNADVLSQNKMRVSKCYLLSKEPTHGHMWPKLGESPHEQEDVPAEQIADCLEKSVLCMPFGDLSPQMVALQNYCRLVKVTQYSYDNSRRTTLLPTDILRYYPHILTYEEENALYHLYELPPDEDEEKKEDEEDDDDDLKKLNEKVEKEKALLAYRSMKHYIWVQMAKANHKYIQQNRKLEPFIEMADENTIFCSFLQFDEPEFKILKGQIPKSQFKKKQLLEVPEMLEVWFKEKLEVVSCFTFDTVPRNDFTLLLDLAAAEIRQWIFTNTEDEPTLKLLEQYMHYVVWDPDNDISEQINSLKSSMTTKTEQSIKNFYIQNNQYLVGNKQVCLVLHQKCVDLALHYAKDEFSDLILMPSYLLFVNLREDQISTLIEIQHKNIQKQSVLTMGNVREDMLLCRHGTIMVCLNKAESNLFTDSCQARLSHTMVLSKLILTHARQTHIRISHFILYQIYKSLLITMCEFFFSFFNGYSSNTLFMQSFHFMYQMFFTSVFSLFLFLWWSDVNHHEIRQNASVFSKCQKDHFFNKMKIVLIFIDTVYQGFIIFYVPASILQYANDQTGIIEGFYYVSLVSFLTLLLTVSLQPFLYLYTITKEQVWLLVINGSGILLLLASCCSNPSVLTNIPQYVYHLNSILNSTKETIFIICFLTAICLTPTLIVHQYLSVLDPQLIDMIHSYKDEEPINKEEDKKKEKEDKTKPKESLKDTTTEKTVKHETFKGHHGKIIDQLDDSSVALKQE